MFDTIGSTLLKLGVGVAATAGLFLLIDTWLDDESESCDNEDENEAAENDPDEMSSEELAAARAAKLAKAAKAAELDDEEDEDADDEEEDA